MTNSEEKTNYQVLINKRSRNFLNQLDNYPYNKILDKIMDLEKEPRPTGCIKLAVKEGYRIKWSIYRILFTINDKEKIIYIYEIAHRKEIYKKK